jgi:MFS transporter, DHA1 family, tetracycline resistance protein
VTTGDIKQKKAVSPMLIAFFTIFLDLLGFGIVIPVNSFYVESLGAGPFVVTLLSACYSLMQFLFAPFWGRLSDRIGRRPIILISVAASGIGHLLFGLSSTLTLVFIARLLAGFGNANLSAAQAIISDTTTAENRSKGMGLIGAAFGLGFLFGPAIGGIAGQYSPQAPALVAAALAGVNLFLAYMFLPETKKDSPSADDQAHSHSHRRLQIFSWETFAKAKTIHNVSTILKISLFNTAAFAMFEVVVGLLMEKSYLPIDAPHNHDHIAAAARLTAWFLVTVGITAVIVQGGLIGRLSKKFGDVKLIRLGLFLMALSLVLLPLFAQNLPYESMLGLAALLALGTGVLNPSQSALMSKSSPEGEQGAYLGLNQSMSALGRVVGPAISGKLFEYSHGTPFFLAGALSLMCFFFSFGLQGAILSQKPNS